MEKKKLLIFGDSNTYGFDADGCGRFSFEKRFSGQLERLIGERWQIFEAGLPGRTADFEDPIAPGMCGSAVLPRRMAQYAPIDLLVIMLGTNDIKERFRASAADAAHGVGKLAELARAQNVWSGKSNILLIAPPIVRREYEELQMAQELGKGCYERSASLPAELKKTAEQLGCRFFDASLLGMRLSNTDGIHMTAEDHLILAEALKTVI